MDHLKRKGIICELQFVMSRGKDSWLARRTGCIGQQQEV